jgi:hypothetical protein
VKITETTQPAPPPPRTFTLEVTEEELRYLRVCANRSRYNPANLSAGFAESFTDELRDVLFSVGPLR